MKHRSLNHQPPEVGEPIVVGGIKYRIRRFIDGLAEARDRYAVDPTKKVTWVKRELMYWDPLAGVWRVES